MQASGQRSGIIKALEAKEKNLSAHSSAPSKNTFPKI